MKAKDFKPWDRVRYVPNHADGDVHHPDCENGIVKSVNGNIIFVVYVKDGLPNTQAESTYINNLIPW